VRVIPAPFDPPESLIAPPSEILPRSGYHGPQPRAAETDRAAGASRFLPPIGEMGPMDAAPPRDDKPPPRSAATRACCPPLPPAPPSARMAPATARDCPPWRSTIRPLPPAPPPYRVAEGSAGGRPVRRLRRWRAPLALPTETICRSATRLTASPCPPIVPAKCRAVWPRCRPRALISACDEDVAAQSRNDSRRAVDAPHHGWVVRAA